MLVAIGAAVAVITGIGNSRHNPTFGETENGSSG